MSRLVRFIAIVPLTLALACGGGDDADPFGEPPVITPIEPADRPYAEIVRRGVFGEYSLTGGNWAFHPAAYTHRYTHEFDRMSVYRAPMTTCDAVRITQPRGYGPPLAAHHEQFAMVEIELYARTGDGVNRYDPSAQNLVRGARVRTSSTHPGSAPGRVIDGTVVSLGLDRAWVSDGSGVNHWIQIELDRNVAWNQLVLYWPLISMPGPGFRDRELAEGIKPQAIVVQVHRGDAWETIEVERVGRGAEHDGHLLGQWLGLDTTPRSRLDHLRAYASDLPLSGPLASPAPDLVSSEGGETIIDDGWTIAIPVNAPDPIRLAATDLQRLLMGSLGVGSVRVAEVQTETPVRDWTIRIGDLASAPTSFRDALGASGRTEVDARCTDPESHAVLVEPTRIWAFGRGALGARFAACRLEERLVTRGAPILANGLETRRPAFHPRIASGVSFGQGGPDDLGFPDGYLSRMAHFYLDGVYLFQAGPYLDVTSVVGSSLDSTLTGDPAKMRQLRSLVTRADRHGLGVYWCLTLPGFLPPTMFDRYPDLRGDDRPHVICLSTPRGRALVTDAVERVLRRIPGLRGLVVLRSELSHTCGGRGVCERCRRSTTEDEDPVLELITWVRDAAHRVDPEVEIIAFDWRGGGVAALREESMPTDVGYWMRPDRLVNGTPECDIRDTSPHPDFANLVTQHRPARRIWVEGQASHPFPFHVQPELPVADLYWRKWAAIRELSERQPAGAPPLAMALGNGSAFLPSSMEDLVLRVLAWDPLPEPDEAFLQVATRWYGERAAEDVKAMWWTFSQAVREHARFEKYLTRRTRTELPGFEHPDLSPEGLASARLLASEWEEGILLLQQATRQADPERADRVAWSVAMAEAAYLGIQSLVHGLQWAEAFGANPPEVVLPSLSGGAESRAREILDAEARTTQRAIVLAAEYPELRQHPYYRNWFGLPALAHKLSRIGAVTSTR